MRRNLLPNSLLIVSLTSVLQYTQISKIYKILFVVL